MNIKQLIFWITVLAVFAMAVRISMDTDTWWHLRAGQWMVENRTILQSDPFSYTREGTDWQYPGWLVEIPMYWIYQAFGPGGLNIFTALMVTLAFVAVWHTLSGGPFLRAFTIVLAAVASAVYWAARPYLVTFVLSAVYLMILEAYRWRKVNRLWLLPILMVPWANSHGGFAAGFLIWGVYFTWSVVRVVLDTVFKVRDLPYFKRDDNDSYLRTGIYLGGVGLLMLLAVCLNPNGVIMLGYPFKTIGISALQDYIQEWQSPNFHELHVQPFAWLFLLVLGAVGISRKRLAITDFLLVAGFTYLSFMATRNIALFALVAPMVITRHLAPVVEAIRRIRGIDINPNLQILPLQKIVNITLLAVITLAVLVKAATVFPEEVNTRYFQETLPYGAVAYLKQANPPGKLFSSYNWGGYLLWALPEYPVFIDGRTDLYNDDVIAEWLKVVRAEEGWGDVLDKYSINTVLIEKDSPLTNTIETNMDWELLYHDSISSVYTR